MTEIEEANIHSYVWSPDGQRLAIWLNDHLAILDVTSHEIVKYCFQVGRNQYFEPVWSPDSRYVAIPNFDNDQMRTLVVDTQSDWAGVVAEGVIPLGWMVSEP